MTDELCEVLEMEAVLAVVSADVCMVAGEEAVASVAIVTGLEGEPGL